MALRDQPYLPLYIDDYLTDERLLMCSDASQGVYIRIMCNFHKQTPYGGIQLKDKDRRHDDNVRDFAVKMANLIPRPVDVLDAAIRELIEENVLSIGRLIDGLLPEIGEYEYATEPTGDFLFQKRMYKAGQISLMRSNVAKIGGGNPALSKEANNDATVFDVEEVEFYPFEEFWNDYDKKVGDKSKLKKKYSAVSVSDRAMIKDYIPKYIASQPEKKFRKNPETFLNNKSWNDEIIESDNGKFPAKNNGSFSNAQDRRASVSNAKNLAATILCGNESEDNSGRF